MGAIRLRRNRSRTNQSGPYIGPSANGMPIRFIIQSVPFHFVTSENAIGKNLFPIASATIYSDIQMMYGSRSVFAFLLTFSAYDFALLLIRYADIKKKVGTAGYVS